MDEVTVEQRLQPQVSELSIPFGLQCRAELVQIEAGELRRHQAEFHPPPNERAERFAVQFRQFRMGGAMIGSTRHADAQKGQRLFAQLVEQQAGGGVGVVRLFLHQHAGGHDQRRRHGVGGDAVVHVAERRLDDALSVHPFQAKAGFVHHAPNARHV